MAITIAEALRGTNAQARVLATDINTQVLKKCREGVYTLKKLDGVSPQLLKRYFVPIAISESDEPHYQVCQQLREMVVFCRLNLSNIPFPMKGPMDIVFIRNVMIYFDNELRSALLEEAHRLIHDDGNLIVGHSEGLTGIVSKFKLIKASVYKK